jgi:glycosyltransferase involved in cell wall biosynthesis
MTLTSSLSAGPVPVVSVVVPTYGRPRQVRDCLAALAAQTLPRVAFEVIVVDDGSPQGLGPLPDEFAGRLRLTLIRQANAGPSVARNRGVEQAAADLVAFTDDDCLPEPTWLERLVQAERDRPGSLVGGSTHNGLHDLVFSEASQWIISMVYEHFNRDQDNAYFFASNNILCSRQRYRELDGFEARFRGAGAEDRDFCDRWRAAGWPLIWRPDAAIEHRHPQSLCEFIGLHYRYGRGAHLYQAMRRSRGTGTMRNDLGFHATLPRRIWAGLARYSGTWRRAKLCGALALWQAANAAGFFTQAIFRRPAASRTR